MLLYKIRCGAGIGRRIHLPVPYAGYLKKQVKFSDHVPLIWDFDVTPSVGRTKRPASLMPAFN
jgi:hypothetical protein